MFLYKVEIVLTDQTVYIIVLADTEEKAFDYVEGHLTRHFIAPPVVKETTIIEKKRVEKGAAYVIETK